jgi:hypothetical protein
MMRRLRLLFAGWLSLCFVADTLKVSAFSRFQPFRLTPIEANHYITANTFPWGAKRCEEVFWRCAFCLCRYLFMHSANPATRL